MGIDWEGLLGKEGEDLADPFDEDGYEYDEYEFMDPEEAAYERARDEYERERAEEAYEEAMRSEAEERARWKEEEEKFPDFGRVGNMTLEELERWSKLRERYKEFDISYTRGLAEYIARWCVRYDGYSEGYYFEDVTKSYDLFTYEDQYPDVEDIWPEGQPTPMDTIDKLELCIEECWADDDLKNRVPLISIAQHVADGVDYIYKYETSERGGRSVEDDLEYYIRNFLTAHQKEETYLPLIRQRIEDFLADKGYMVSETQTEGDRRFYPTTRGWLVFGIECCWEDENGGVGLGEYSVGVDRNGEFCGVIRFFHKDVEGILTALANFFLLEISAEEEARARNKEEYEDMERREFERKKGSDSMKGDEVDSSQDVSISPEEWNPEELPEC